ncbi:hypothetical protein Tco_0121083 [Tanacetum coccineum]
MEGQQALNPVVEMMLVVIDEWQVLGMICEEPQINDLQLMPEDSEIVPSSDALHLHRLHVASTVQTSCNTSELSLHALRTIWFTCRRTYVKGSSIGVQEKKAKLFNEWKRFTSIEGESIESYYHHFSKLMNDFSRNKHFPKKIASNLKFLNNLQPEWQRSVSIVHQTKDLHEIDYIQLYNFLKFNQVEVDAIREIRLDTMQGRLQGIRMGIANPNVNENGNVVAARAEGNAKEFNLMAAARNIDEIEEVNANCILMENLHCYDNDIFNMFTQEKQYTELLEPITEPHTVQQNNINVISVESIMELNGGTVEQHPATDKLLQLALECPSSKMKQLNKEIKQANYAKINKLYEVFVSQKAKSCEEADESHDKISILEKEIERLWRVVVSQDIMSIVQRPTIIETSNLQTELERTKEKFENCIIKKETKNAKHRNDWYKKCEECKYDKILYDKAYNNMHHQIERLQPQLGDIKGKSMDTQCASDTLDPSSQKLEDENMSLEFQVLNFAKNVHLKTTYKNLFDFIKVTRAQTKIITDSLQDKLNDTIYENAKLRA